MYALFDMARTARCEAPLVEPGLVTPTLWGKHPDEFMARGVLVCNATGHWTVHSDIFDLEQRAVETEEWQAQVITDSFAKQFERMKSPVGCASHNANHRLRFGSHAALHCQADSVVSVASYIRSGRLIHRLFDVLYRLPSSLFPFEWSFRGINIGAGIDSYPTCSSSDQLCNQDDPLDLWMGMLAQQVLLIDSDMSRLQHALSKLHDKRAQAESVPSQFYALNKATTPLDIDAGELDEILTDAFRGVVDIIKIDIDSYDCDVLVALLLKVEALVIVLESQPLVPPPFKFARAFSSDDPLEHGLTGCSLAYQLRILSPNYHLLVYTEQDTVFVHSKLLSLFESLPAGTLFPWTRYPLLFPVDELDCYQRSRFLHAADAADRSLGGDHSRGLERVTPPAIPVDFVREWLHSTTPRITLDLIWRNITGIASSTSTAPLENVRYILDL